MMPSKSLSLFLGAEEKEKEYLKKVLWEGEILQMLYFRWPFLISFGEINIAETKRGKNYLKHLRTDGNFLSP